MSIPCEKSGCTSACEQLLRSENQELRDKIKMLQNTFDSESDKKSSTSSTEEKVNEIFVKQTKSDLESSQEHIKRLKEDYDEAMKKNQELENRILQMAEELQLEKSRFEETVGSMSEQLMNFVEKMNKMERECIQNKRDCSLVVQLLKCNQSLDKKFVSQKVKTMPSDLQEKLTLELNITPESKPLNHPARSRKLWRTKSASSASTSSPSELSDAEQLKTCK